METMEIKEMLGPKIKLWMLVAVAFALVGLGVWSYWTTYHGWIDSNYLAESWPPVKWGLVCLVVSGFWFWHIRARTYRLTEDGVEAERGLWWSELDTIPYHKIRMVKVFQSIEGRWLNYGRIDVEWAGSGDKHENRIRMRSIRNPKGIKAEIEKRMRA